jgi:hypothetical protein
VDLSKIVQRRQKERLDKLLKDQQQQEAVQVLKEGWKSIRPYLRKAYLRRELMNTRTIFRLLENHTVEEFMEYSLQLLKVPVTPEEAKIQLLSDIVIGLVYPEPETENKIETIIQESLGEIDELYTAILQKGGGPGWSFDPKKDKPNKRKMIALEWCRRNQVRLSYLKEKYLQDTDLYNFGSGQERRNFTSRLIIKIVNDEIGKKLNFSKVKAYLGNLKTLQPLQIKDL